MVRSVKKPIKKICTLCKKYRVRLTVKRGGKRVYKTKSVLMKQLKRKMKGRSKFGSSCQSGYNPMKMQFGKRRHRGVKRHTTKRRTTRKRTTRRRSGFGKTAQIRKLHKLCKVYGVKIGRKSPSVLRKQCLKKAKTMLKKINRRSRFGDSANLQAAKDQTKIEEEKDPRLVKRKDNWLMRTARASAQFTPGGQLFIDSNKKKDAAEASRIASIKKEIDAKKRRDVADEAAKVERVAARTRQIKIDEDNRIRKQKQDDEDRVRKQKQDDDRMAREQKLSDEKRAHDNAVQLAKLQSASATAAAATATATAAADAKKVINAAAFGKRQSLFGKKRRTTRRRRV